MVRSAVGAAAALMAGASWAVNDMPGGPGVNQLNLTQGVTRIAADQWWIHNFLLVVCIAIFFAVFGVLFYSLWAHRKSRGAKSADFHESTAVEIAWTIVPFIIVVGLAIPATRMVVEQKDTSQADLTIKATGYQWKWGYEYLKGEGAGISMLSTLSTPQAQIDGKEPKSETYLMEVDNALVVPVGQKIRMVITANDVIHAWMVPAFGVKQDAIPGFVRDTWFRAEKTGDFYGQCAELCGKEHAYMPIHVKVLSAQDYAKWVEGKKKEMAAKADDPTKVWKLEDLAARGEKIYAANCVACHQTSGKGAGPIKALDGSALVLDADKSKQIAIMLNGAANGAMPAWKQLSDTEIAAVITYTKNNWGNKTGQVVQPADIVAARK
jgi:cytochrome c oxidase subunit 2